MTKRERFTQLHELVIKHMLRAHIEGPSYSFETIVDNVQREIREMVDLEAEGSAIFGELPINPHGEKFTHLNQRQFLLDMVIALNDSKIWERIKTEFHDMLYDLSNWLTALPSSISLYLDITIPVEVSLSDIRGGNYDIDDEDYERLAGIVKVARYGDSIPYEDRMWVIEKIAPLSPSIEEYIKDNPENVELTDFDVEE